MVLSIMCILELVCICSGHDCNNINFIQCNKKKMKFSEIILSYQEAHQAEKSLSSFNSTSMN